VITIIRPRRSPSARLSLAFFDAARSDRFERPGKIAAAMERDPAVVRRADIVTTRRLEAVAVPLLAFVIGFGFAFGI